ncbi:hypothetical protein EFN04_11040, partial [Propionibacterium freudenreichii]|nr:hypothetical protein [Propionibacterium freudenreichii]
MIDTKHRLAIRQPWLRTGGRYERERRCRVRNRETERAALRRAGAVGLGRGGHRLGGSGLFAGRQPRPGRG